MQQFLENDKIRQVLFLVVLSLLGLVILFELSDLLGGILGSIILYILFRPCMRYLSVKRKWKINIAATVTVLLSLIVIILPTLILFDVLYQKINEIIVNQHISFRLSTIDYRLRKFLGYDIISPKSIQMVQDKIAVIVPELLGNTFSIFGDIAIAYFIFFFLLVNTGKLEEWLHNIIPLKNDNVHILGQELLSMTYSNVLGVPLLGAAQALASIVLFYICQLQDALFWGIVCGIFSFIPFVGSALVWVPAGLIQLGNGATWQGVVILVGGILAISNIDNVLRFVIQKRFADIHPLITVFGVILGLKLFGLPGLIFGPLLISYFFILSRIYKNEFLEQTIILDTNV